MRITAAGVLLRSLPNPLTLADLAPIRDARPRPPPIPASESIRVEGRISCRGSLTVARQRIQVGMEMPATPSPSRLPTTSSASSTAANSWRRSLAPPPLSIARFKVRKPKPPDGRP